MPFARLTAVLPAPPSPPPSTSKLEADLAGLRPRLMSLEGAAKAREGEAARLTVLLDQVHGIVWTHMGVNMVQNT